MGISVLDKFGLGAPVPVFAAVGAMSLGRAEHLTLDPGVRLVGSPRHAAILLVTGDIGDKALANLRRLHDQLPHPRATVWWSADPASDWDDPIIVTSSERIATVLSSVWRALLSGKRQSEADCLPDAPPNPWRGVGPNGQGGKGMMGGTPYGRPMAMTGEDIRDGLSLDIYSAPFGPFLPSLPHGLVLDMTLQGDVIQRAEVERPPYKQDTLAATPLVALARILRLLELPALAERFVRAAIGEAAGRSADVAALRRAFLRSGALWAIPPGLGRTPDDVDLRDRLELWWAAAAGEPVAAASFAGAAIGDLLRGLEWQEAMLVLNSFDLDALRQACVEAMEQAKSKEAV